MFPLVNNSHAVIPKLTSAHSIESMVAILRTSEVTKFPVFFVPFVKII